MNKPYDLAIYIGRFQPFHLGHLHVLEQCKNLATNTLVLIGSSFRPRTLKNPFTFDERAEMICSASISIKSNVDSRPLRDFVYRQDRWAAHVQKVVAGWIAERKQVHPDMPLERIALVGHYRDSSSFYLKEFPQWNLVEVDEFEDINATAIRDSLLRTHMPFDQWRNTLTAKKLPETTKAFFGSVKWADEKSKRFEVDDILKEMREEYAFVQEYKKSWEVAPYPVTFNTVDAVVIQQGHILLIQRGEQPGKGLWALPGGFLEPKETLLQGMLRELIEETGLKIPERFLRKLHEENRDLNHTFDAPDRSSRGRTLTTAFFTPLDTPPDGKLPHVKGGDDATKARWVPLSEVNSLNMFEDHYDIVDYFVPITGL